MGGLEAQDLKHSSKNAGNHNQIDSLDIYPSPNVNLIADAHYLPFPKESYDIIIIQAVLEHVINPYKVVSEIYRILKKGHYLCRNAFSSICTYGK